MGREIYCQIIDPKARRVVWDSADALELFVCGRDEATTCVAARADDSDDELFDCAIDVTKREEFDSIRSELRLYAKKDQAEVEAAKRDMEDLCAARRNARNYDDFCSFAGPIEELREQIDSAYSRAEALIEMMDKSREVFDKEFPEDVLCIRVSE